MIGQVTQFAGTTAPANHMFCDGASLAVASYAALYAVIGNTFGGDATNFNLPNVKGRSIIGPDTGKAVGSIGGGSTTLTEAQLPEHEHVIHAYSDDGETDEPNDAFMAKAGGGEAIYVGESDIEMAPTGKVGSGAAVPTQSPYAVINSIIQVS